MQVYNICFITIINYQQGLIAFVITIRVALHEYQEYNMLSYCLSWTTQSYNSSPTFSMYTQRSGYMSLKTDNIYLFKQVKLGVLYVVNVHPVYSVEVCITRGIVRIFW
jgi:hypothetical protein